MNAVILNGADQDDPVLCHAYACADAILRNVGYTVSAFTLRDISIAWCRGCFGCWVATPGVCAIDDFGRVLASAVVNSSITVWLSPVRFGGYSSNLKKSVDRLVCLISPFFMKKNGVLRKKTRYSSYPALAVAGSLPAHDPELEAVFSKLVSRNALSLHAPACANAVLYHSYSNEQIAAVVSAMLAETGVLL